MEENKPKTEPVFPLFKFLSKKWSNELIDKGSFRLSKIQEFRDNSRYKNHIHDSLEGIMHIENHYDIYEGLVKDSNGLLLNLLNPLAQISAKDLKLEHEINIYKPLVYCTTNHFLSDSLNQAIEDGKDSCVLITYPEKFFKIISNSINDYELSSIGQCIYKGKNIFEKNPGHNSITNQLIANPLHSIYYKPKEYINQREVRAIWTPKHNNTVESITGEIKELSNYCIPISFDDIDKQKILNYSRGQQIGARIIFKNKKISSFEIERPYQVCTPMIEEVDGRIKLVFVMTEDGTAHYENIKTEACGLIFDPPHSKIVPLNGDLSDIERIEYYSL